MYKKNYNRPESILHRCSVIEIIIMTLHPLWKKETNPKKKKELYMSIHDNLFKIPLLKKQWSGKISEAALKDPTYLSKDHDIRRKIIARKIFEDFEKLGITGDGTTILKIVEEFTFSYVTKLENNPNYDDKKVNKIEIKSERMDKIERYNRLSKKGWFRTRKIENPELFDNISLNLKYKTEEQFFHWIN